MRIFIPTIHRSDNLATLDSLLADGQCPYEIILVTSEAEEEKYQKYRSKVNQIFALPNEIRIAETRQWIINSVLNEDDTHVLMMDDDLRFFKREDINDPTLRKLNKGELHVMLNEMNNLFNEGYVHLSMSARMGNNRKNGEKVAFCERPYRVYGFDATVLNEEGIKFQPDNLDHPFTMDDFHVTLCLLELGYQNAILWDHVHDQFGSNSEGGASTYRTLAQMSKCAHALAAAHPGFVRVVQKTTTHSWNGETRDDVVIQWKKAFCSRESERKMFK